jgi:RNA polymerase sigma factor (sigma-70 family)
VTLQTDSDLLRDYAASDCESAFGELVNRHIGLVYSVAIRVVVDTHLAEDVTQTTFAILAREARHLTGRALLSSWLHRTALNQAAKLVRGEMRRRAREQEAYAMQTVPSESDLDWKQVAPLLDAALNKLAEADRAVILLRFFEKKTASEIGTALKVSEAAAQKRISRALERLRGILAGRGVTLSGTALATLVGAQAVGTVPAGLSTSVSAAALAASAAASGITFTTLKLILMSKLKVSALSALVVAGVATPLVIQQQNLSRLREENQSLEQQARQAGGLRGENEELVRQLSDARRSQGLSKAQLSELLRLRGELGPLRRDSQELARLRLKQQGEQAATIQPAAVPDFIPGAAWANVGADKPEAAIQTFFWAGKHGETNLVASLLRWRRDEDIPSSDELDEMFGQGMIGGATRFAGSLQGFRIQSLQKEGDDEVRLALELTDKDGKVEPHTLRLVREDNQWFPVMHVWLQGPGSVRGALDAPPKFSQAR